MLLLIEVTGDEDKINSLVQLLKPFRIREIMMTGRVAMVRGSENTGGRIVSTAGTKENASDTEAVP